MRRKFQTENQDSELPFKCKQNLYRAVHKVQKAEFITLSVVQLEMPIR